MKHWKYADTRRGSSFYLALADALHILGYGKTYHMRNVREEGHTEVWLAFIAAKFEGKETGFMLDRPHFDSFLKGYGVLLSLNPQPFLSRRVLTTAFN